MIQWAAGCKRHESLKLKINEHQLLTSFDLDDDRAARRRLGDSGHEALDVVNRMLIHLIKHVSGKKGLAERRSFH